MRMMVGVAAVLLVAGAASAQEVTLRAASAFGIDTQYGKPFKTFVDEVNARGKGKVQIRLVGGPEAVPPAETATATRNGVIELGWTPPNFYENLMPEATVTALANVGPDEWRKNGAWELLSRLHNEKAGVELLAGFGWGVQHHLYLTQKLDKPDLTGLKVRPAPGMQAFFHALGAATVPTMPGEVFTALERGVIQGYSWPVWGVTDLGWHRVTKFRTEPGYGGVQVNMLMNLNAWRRLNDDQRTFMRQTLAWFDEWSAKTIDETTKSEAQKQTDAGIQVIRWAPEDAARYVRTFNETMWAEVVRKAPEHGPRLRSLMYKPQS